MKKLFLIIVCATCTMTMSAQRASSTSSSFFSTEKAEQPITFGVRAGVNFATLGGDAKLDDDADFKPHTRTVFHVGVNVDIPILQSFYVKSGLYYTQKGWKAEGEVDAVEDITWETTGSPSFIELPILASYRYNFSDNAQLEFNVGPYVAYGLGGKLNTKLSVEDRPIKEHEKYFDKKEGGYKKFDVGYQIGLGFTAAKHYYIGATYEYGLVKAHSKNFKVYNSNFMISLGYNF